VLTRRGFLLRVGGTTSVLLLTACGGATAPAAPTVAPAKPTDAPKPPQAAASPVASPASSPGAAASPATSASPVAGASPAASPAASPSPAAQAAPAAQTAALPNLRGTTLNILQWSNFVPNADPFFKKQIEDGFMKETGAQVNVEFIDQNTIAPKISAAVQSGSGPDIVMFAHNWPHTYAEGLVDISDVAQDVQRVTGPFFPASTRTPKSTAGTWASRAISSASPSTTASRGLTRSAHGSFLRRSTSISRSASSSRNADARSASHWDRASATRCFSPIR
jgi:hypothetical protein